MLKHQTVPQIPVSVDETKIVFEGQYAGISYVASKPSPQAIELITLNDAQGYL